MQGWRRGQGERRRRGAVQDRLDAAVLGLGQGVGERRGRRGGESRGGWLGGGDVLLGLGGGRGRGGETEQRAEASRGGQRRPKLMGGHCGNHVVKYTCKNHTAETRGRAREWGREGGRERAGTSGKESERGRGQREKQGLSQVVHSSKQSLRQAHRKQTESVHREQNQSGLANRTETPLMRAELISGLAHASV